MDKGIMGFSGFGVSFSLSTISLITFLVFLERLDAGTFHDVLFSDVLPLNNPFPSRRLLTTDPDAFLSSPLVGIITKKSRWHKLHLSQKYLNSNCFRTIALNVTIKGKCSEKTNQYLRNRCAFIGFLHLQYIQVTRVLCLPIVNQYFQYFIIQNLNKLIFWIFIGQLSTFCFEWRDCEEPQENTFRKTGFVYDFLSVSKTYLWARPPFFWTGTENGCLNTSVPF